MLTMTVERALMLDECVLPPGVRVKRIPDEPTISNDWLQWCASPIAIPADETSVGLLRSQRVDSALFEVAEWHTEAELFLMIAGEGTILLPDGQAWQLVRLPEGTVLRVERGTPHYWGPAVSSEAVCAVATSATAQTRYVYLA